MSLDLCWASATGFASASEFEVLDIRNADSKKKERV